MIIIRADGNSLIGQGHITRCMSVALSLCYRGEAVTIVTADDKSVRLLQKYGAKHFLREKDYLLTYHVLGSDYEDMEAELEYFLSFIKRNNPKAILIDSYYVTKNYLESVSKVCKTLYMDELDSFDYPVWGVINYNIYGEELYSKREGKQFFLGTKYVPLREEFTEADKITISKEVGNVLITTGGSDSLNIAEHLVKKIKEEKRLKDITLHVICGPFSNAYDKLKDLRDEYGNLVIYRNVEKMSEVMAKCDIAISAGGSTMYELSAMGIPTLSFYFVDNQKKIVLGFEKNGAAISLGDFRGREEELPLLAVEKLLTIIKDEDLRKSLSEKCSKLVDGLGAERIADILV